MVNKAKELLGSAAKPALYIVIGFVLGIFVCRNFFSGSSHRSLSVTFPGGYELALDATQDRISIDSVYSSIQADNSLWAGLIARLADDQVYAIMDPSLADALHEYLCSPIPEQPTTERIRASRECAELPVARRLRQLAEIHDLPFHYVGREIKVGVPSRDHQPQLGLAHACRNSEFRDRRVELTNPRSKISVTVRASGSYECTGYNQYPDIQLSYTDAHNLFGRPMDKYEAAIAVVLD